MMWHRESVILVYQVSVSNMINSKWLNVYLNELVKSGREDFHEIIILLLL